MLVHLVKALEHFAKLFRPDRQHRRKPDRRIHGIPTPDPVPKFEHVRRVDPEFLHFGRIRRDRDEMPRDGAHVAPHASQQPVAGRGGIGHGLEGGKGLGGNDEQGLRRIEIAYRLHEVRPVDVRDKTKRHVAFAVSLERLIGHYRPQVGAADADVDDILDRPIGVSEPCTAANFRGESAHFIEHRMYGGHHVVTAHSYRRIARSAKRDV